MTVLRFLSKDDVELVLPRVAAHLDNGGLLAYPTETVYGLGSRANILDLADLSKLTERPRGKPYLLLVAGCEMARAYGISFTEAAARLAERFWPGPLTLVLAASESQLPNSLRGDLGIAVRWSSHPHTSRLIEALGMPITSTSANRSGREPLPDVGTICAEFRDAVNSGKLILLDGGRICVSPPSTLIDCTSAEPRILREGAITHAQIRACIEEVGL
jgi:L-threonylcarbamoyladenylate synthase